MSDRDRAESLAQQLAKLQGFTPAKLNSQGRIAYGTLQFEHDAANNKLLVMILISDDQLWDKLGEPFRQNYLKSTQALDDPAIGGMFDTAGGRWRFEPASGKTFLYKAYPLDIAADKINEDASRMIALAPAWEARWSRIVAEVSQGKRLAPRQKVTLQDDPYRDEF